MMGQKKNPLATYLFYKNNKSLELQSVLRIRIHVFLGLLDPDPEPLVTVKDPDPSIIKHK